MIENKKYTYLLGQIGIEVRSNRIAFISKKKSQEQIIEFNDIQNISIVDAQVGLSWKILFWLIHILTFQTFSGRALFGESLDYRYVRLLSIQLKNGQELTKYIKGIDLISTSKAIELLNEEIRNTT